MSLIYADALEIEKLATAFNARTLKQELWTHEAHLTVAIWHLKKHNFFESVCLMRSGIISYNLSVGGSNTSSKGYHETLTVFWMKVIDFFIRYNNEKTLPDTCNQFLATPLSAKDIPFYFYERKTILSPMARAVYVGADKMPLNDNSLQQIYERVIMSIH